MCCIQGTTSRKYHRIGLWGALEGVLFRDRQRIFGARRSLIAISHVETRRDTPSLDILRCFSHLQTPGASADSTGNVDGQIAQKVNHQGKMVPSYFWNVPPVALVASSITLTSPATLSSTGMAPAAAESIPLPSKSPATMSVWTRPG